MTTFRSFDPTRHLFYSVTSKVERVKLLLLDLKIDMIAKITVHEH